MSIASEKIVNDRSLLHHKSAGFLSGLLVLALVLLGMWIGHGWLGHGLYKAALLALPFVAGAAFGFNWKDKSIDWRSATVTGLLLGGAAAVALALVLPLVADPAEIRAGFDQRYGYTPVTIVIAALLIATANAALEEWFYRGFLDRAAGLPFSLAIFGLQHYLVLRGIAGDFPALLAGGGTVIAGYVWTRLARRDRNLVGPFISHFLADLVLFTAGLALLGYFG